MLGKLRDWLIGWADSPAGPAMLGVLTAAEAIAFPIPPDPLLIALALRNPSDALLLAGLTTAASVLGGLVGHWLGLRFGRPLLNRLHSRQVERVEGMFRRHGFLAIVVAGLTPIPYKVFTISAGVFGISRTPFVLASIVGRGMRFFAFGGLIFVWGDRFQEFPTARLDLLMAVAGAGLILALVAWAAWTRFTRRAPAGSGTNGG
jgi:membrane protein YqaA with SNARE-associated domain